MASFAGRSAAGAAGNLPGPTRTEGGAFSITFDDHGLAERYVAASDEINMSIRTAMTAATAAFEQSVVQFTPRGAGPVHLFQTVTSEVRGAPVSLTGRVFSTDIPVKVASVVNGRKPGKWPPYGAGSSLRLWVERMIGGSDAEIKSTAFLIARAIGKRGTTGAHMFEKGFQAQRGNVENMFDKVIGDLMRRLS
jgi:hypothetical protein